MNPLESLLRSRKFWLMILDVVVSIATYIAGNLLGEQAREMVLWLIGLLQPVFVAIITAIAYEDGQAKRAGNFPAV